MKESKQVGKKKLLLLLLFLFSTLLGNLVSRDD
jgi:hypothetical protein